MKRSALTATITALCIFFTLSLAHAEDPKARGEAGDVLTPLAIGNTWVYVGEDDEIITTDRIEGVVLFDNQPWHLLRTYERETGKPVTDNVSIGADLWLAMIDGSECDGFTQINEETDELELTMSSKYYRYPATLGDSYKPNVDDPTTTVTVIALNKKVTTKAGEFDCVVYKETSSEDENYSYTCYVAPGVGIVKNIHVDEEGSYTSELISYTLVDGK